MTPSDGVVSSHDLPWNARHWYEPMPHPRFDISRQENVTSNERLMPGIFDRPPCLKLCSPATNMRRPTSKPCCVGLTPIYDQSTTCRKPWHHVMTGVSSALRSTSTAPLRRRAKNWWKFVYRRCECRQIYLCCRPYTIVPKVLKLDIARFVASP